MFKRIKERGKHMRFIVIGCLGSMGRRRIRNLKALGYTDVIGYDLVDCTSRKMKAIPTCWYTDMLDEVENFLENPTGLYKKVDGIIISVPPLQKQEYIDLANKYNVPVFVEADVCLYNGNYHSSATMRFNPAIQKIKDLLDSGTLGKVYTFNYHMGQSIYDWHPGCNMKTYYAAQKDSGACREMFCFELSWLSWLFGAPVDVKGMIDKRLDDPDITADDVFATVVKFNKQIFQTDNTGDVNGVSFIRSHAFQESITGIVLIDIVSRPAIRELRIVGEKCNLLWNWDEDNIQLEHQDGEISMIFYPKGQAAKGYNSNICEEMYQNELANWIDALQGKEQYLYSREDEKAVISMLRKVEV
jgi:predicted dehydrogenase